MFDNNKATYITNRRAIQAPALCRSVESLTQRSHKMSITPVALASITAAVSVLGTEYLKGIATDEGKGTWSGIKALFGWTSDPAPAEIPEKVATALTASPD